MRSQYKRPQSVLVVIYTVAGEVLLLRRCHPCDFWQSVTGSLDWGEAAAVAARRELHEETGLGADVTVLDCAVANRFPILPAWRTRYAPGVDENIEYVFRVCLSARRRITLNPREHCEFLWLPRDEAADKASSYTNRDAILQFVPS